MLPVDAIYTAASFVVAVVVVIVVVAVSIAAATADCIGCRSNF